MNVNEFGMEGKVTEMKEDVGIGFGQSKRFCMTDIPTMGHDFLWMYKDACKKNDIQEDVTVLNILRSIMVTVKSRYMECQGTNKFYPL